MGVGIFLFSLNLENRSFVLTLHLIRKIIFEYRKSAIAAEEILKTNDVHGRLVLIPRELSAGCGMAWRAKPEDQEQVEKLLKQNKINLNQLAVL